MFTAIFLQPLLNLLVGLYNALPGNDLGIAIIALTFLVKLILWPFTALQIKQQRALQAIQPKIDEIRAKYKDDREAQGRELMSLYSREKVNPAASCLPLLIQIPVFIGLYRALSQGISSFDSTLLYPFIENPGVIHASLLGIVDLTKRSIPLALGAAVVQFYQSRQLLKNAAPTMTPPPTEVADSPGAQDESMATIMNRQMTYTMPILTAAIGWTLPAGLTLYWFVMSLLSVVQQWWITRSLPPKIVPQLQS